jgi:hypothetical protein
VELHSRGRLFAMHTIIRNEKALAYNITILIAAVKSFIVHATGRVCV